MQQVCISQNVDYFFKTWLAHAFITLRMLRTLENKNKIMTGACSDHLYILIYNYFEKIPHTLGMIFSVPQRVLETQRG